MADANSLEVKNLQISQTVRMNPQGEAVRFTIVRYNIGTHGPFQDEYGPGQNTAEAINRGIEAHKAVLRQVYLSHNIGPTAAG